MICFILWPHIISLESTAVIVLVPLYGRESWSLVLSDENTRGLSVFENVEMLEKMHSENFPNFTHITNFNCSDGGWNWRNK